MNSMTNQNAHEHRAGARRLLLGGLLLFALGGCGVSESDGEARDTIVLPTDDTIPFDLHCEDVGIFPNQCVLDDPNNPYARSIVSEDTKFDLDADAPSATAKFYVWATALARGAGAPGENQFYVALNLHRMWASSNSEPTRLQALRAYRAYLDNFFDSVTFFEIPVDSGNFFPFSLNVFTGELLFDPVDLSNTFNSTRLFNPDPNVNRDMASIKAGEWGYIYDQTTEVFTRF